MATKEQLSRYLQFLEVDPGNLSLIIASGNMAYELGLFDQALELAERGLTIAPAHAELKALRGLVNLSTHHVGLAQSEFEALISEGQGAPVIRYNLAYCRALDGDFEAALALLDDAEAQYKDIPQMLHLKVAALHHLAKVSEAIDLAQAVISQHPDDAVLAGMLSSLHIDNEDYQAAAYYVAVAMKSGNPSADTYASQGSLYLIDQDDDQALSCFEQAIQRKVNNGRAWLGKGLAEMLQNRLPEAQGSFDHAVKYMPNHLGTWQALIWCCIAQGNWSLAEEYVQKSMAMDDTFSESHGALAIIQLNKGQVTEAKSSIRRALKLDPHSFSGQYAQTKLLEYEGQAEQADKVLQAVLDTSLMPDQGTLRDVLVNRLIKSSRKAEQ
ncbi:hypothetical protein ED236_11685 [Pseudomethylobacillus aquaticus]|uniref:Uncharacterized protein n=1 Tax=Pseudomethylobacillus aquaticus TaxID=2676064 RepID=A0A3N0UV15_9PROT|nr:tetratricopeptide repeat protein [Pseudomethylobacillus aquaticus]ROH84058.1 hypothetical protein ED236_11685 [Pseudomethylobacillus aquaticus]